MPCAKSEDVEVMLLKWIKDMRSQNLTLTKGILLEKAKFFAVEFSDEEFSASLGLLQKFIERHIVISKKVCGEKASVDKEIVTIS